MIFESVQMREKLIWFLHYFIILEDVEKVKISRLNLTGPFDDSRYQVVPMIKRCENTIPVILRNLNMSDLANMWLNIFDKNNKLESANVWLRFLIEGGKVLIYQEYW